MKGTKWVLLQTSKTPMAPLLIDSFKYSGQHINLPQYVKISQWTLNLTALQYS